MPDYKSIFESVPGPCLVLTPTFEIAAVNDAYLKATMTQRDQIVGRGLFEVFPDNPEDLGATGTSNLRTSLDLVLKYKSAHTMALQRYDIRRPEELGAGFETRFWSPTNFPILGPSLDVAFILHTVRDVTDYVRLEQANQRQGVATQELLEQTGALESELFRRAQEVDEANRNLEVLRDELDERVRQRTAELEATNASLLEAEGQLQQSQKLELVGHLAGGIAHDFNNLLSVILSYADPTQSDPTNPDEVRENLAEIREAAHRAAELTRQLLAFSRRQVLDLHVLNLNEVIQKVGRMVTRLLGEDIELSLKLAPAGCRVLADPGQMEQVLMNLAVNARDAMPNGGRLTIETSEVNAPGEEGRIRLAVKDSGIGMSEETRERIFEPFFTTKPVGKGTGLGLSTVFGIVKQSLGQIAVQSEPGVGTTFEIFLPRSEKDANWNPDRQAVAPYLRGSETILLVEDEPQVRAVSRSILERLGYRVLASSGPDEALKVEREHRGTIDLLLTDMIMPRMNGRELASRVAQENRHLKTIFVSGYTDNLLLDQSLLDIGDGFLPKPFTPETLSRKVRAILDLGSSP